MDISLEVLKEIITEGEIEGTETKAVPKQ